MEGAAVSIDGDVDDLVAPLSVIADIDAIFPALRCGIGEGNLAVVFFHGKGLSARIQVVIDKFTILIGGFFGLYLCLALGVGETESVGHECQNQKYFLHFISS